MPIKEDDRYVGTWRGREIKFKASFGGHEFTDEEAQKLLDGEYISFPAKSKRTGGTYMAYGCLDEQTFTNNEGRDVTFIGFKPDFEHAPDMVPVEWCNHKFTADERRELEAGNTVHCEDFVSSAGKHFTADIIWSLDEDRGRKRIMFA